jgi:glycosyltransferase involved in cell wall biosynthesis
MKKKILFMVINMNIGGTEKALLNMIAEMPAEDYDITILMLEKCGGFLDAIPSRVHVKYLHGYRDIKDLLNKPPKEMAIALLKRGSMIKCLGFTAAYLLSKITKNKGIFFNYILENTISIEKEYDIAVAYAGPMDFISYFVVKKIKAEKKVQWIHFDVTKIGFDVNFAAKIYKAFDKLFVVSNEGKQKLTDMLPALTSKAEIFSNVVSSEMIMKQAADGKGFRDQFNGIRILTVGRLSKEKGQDLIVPVLTRLKKGGLNVRWYCIGEGNARQEYEQLIKKYGLEQELILLGAISNPYPFMKQCDIYVQPSRHEGYCITLAEAKCFNNPIISTNFTGAYEQLSHIETGIIVDFDEQQMINAIFKIINGGLSKSDWLRKYRQANMTGIKNTSQ